MKVVLLTGSMTAKEKRKVYDRIECGLAKIIIGTHALIQDKVFYDNLALVITDEQHRFGVKQRETFANKGGVPHVLVTVSYTHLDVYKRQQQHQRMEQRRGNILTEICLLM